MGKKRSQFVVAAAVAAAAAVNYRFIKGSILFMRIKIFYFQLFLCNCNVFLYRIHIFVSALGNFHRQ